MVAAGLSYTTTTSVTVGGNTTVTDEYDAVGDGYARSMPTSKLTTAPKGVWKPRPSIIVDGVITLGPDVSRWAYEPAGDPIPMGLGIRRYNADLDTYTDYRIQDALGLRDRMSGYAIMPVSLPNIGDWCYPSPTHLILVADQIPQPYAAVAPSNTLGGGTWHPVPLTLNPWHTPAWRGGDDLTPGDLYQGTDLDGEPLFAMTSTVGLTSPDPMVRPGSPLDVRFTFPYRAQHSFHGLPPDVEAGARATVRPAISGGTPDTPDLVVTRTDTLFDLTTVEVETDRIAMTLDSVDGNDHHYVRSLGSVNKGTLTANAIAFEYSVAVDVKEQSNTGVVARVWHKRPSQFLPMAVSNGLVGGTGWFPGWMWKPA